MKQCNKKGFVVNVEESGVSISTGISVQVETPSLKEAQIIGPKDNYKVGVNKKSNGIQIS